MEFRDSYCWRQYNINLLNLDVGQAFSDFLLHASQQAIPQNNFTH